MANKKGKDPERIFFDKFIRHCRNGTPGMESLFEENDTELESGQLKFDVNKCDETGFSGLHYCARYNRPVLMKYLTENLNANVDCLSIDMKQGALHLVAKYYKPAKRSDGTEEEKECDYMMDGYDQGKEVDSLTIQEILDKERKHLGEMQECVKSSQVEVLQILFAKNAAINVIDQYGKTPLIYAAIHNILSVARVFCLREDIKADHIDHSGKSALMYAAENGYIKMVRLLASYSHSEPPSSTEPHSSVLHLLCQSGHLYAVCSYLMQIIERYTEQNNAAYKETFLKTSVYLKDTSGMLPIQVACKNGSYALVKFLHMFVKHYNPYGNDLTKVKTSAGDTLMHLAVRGDSPELVDYLYELVPSLLNEPNNRAQSPLHLAAFYGSEDCIEQLIQKQATLEARDKDANTPLLSAVLRNSLGSMKKLLENEANLMAVQMSAKSALFLACENESMTILQHFHDKINDHAPIRELISLTDNDGNTVMHAAADRNHEKMAKLLVNMKAPYNERNDLGETPLHTAASKGCTEMVRYLLSLPMIEPDCLNDQKDTPMHLAANEGYFEIVDLLLRSGADLSRLNMNKYSPFDNACCTSNTDIVEFMLKRGADPSFDSMGKAAPILHAAYYGQTDICKLLLEKKADPTVVLPKNSLYTDIPHQYNALEVAIACNHSDLVEVLLLDKKWWRPLLRKRCPESMELTPMRMLIREMPDMANIVLDNCITKETTSKKIKYTRYDYEFIDDEFTIFQGDDRQVNYHNLRTSMSRIDNLLKHSPLARATNEPIEEDKEKNNDNEENDDEDEGDEESKEAGKDSAAGIGSLTEFDDVKLAKIQNTPSACLSNYPYTAYKLKRRGEHPLNVMADSDAECLLKHKLTQRLLNYKWNKFCQLAYTFMFIFYLGFLICFSVYILGLTPPYKFTHNETTAEPFDFTEVCNDMKDKNLSASQNKMLDYFKWGVIVFAVLNLLVEFLQMYLYRFEYLTDFENMLQLTIYTLSFVTVADVSACARETSLKTDVQWQCASLGAFLAWINLIIYMKMTPGMGIYVIMFNSVMVTFCKFFAVFFTFILAFGFSFYILMSNQVQFDSLANSFFKMGVTMIGEINYSDTYNARFDEPTYSNSVFYPAITYALFILFLVMMNIIIMNLLVGLAVEDISKVQKEANIQKLRLQVNMALKIESMLPSALARKFYKIESREFPAGDNEGLKDEEFDEEITKSKGGKIKNFLRQASEFLKKPFEDNDNDEDDYKDDAEKAQLQESIDTLRTKLESAKRQQLKSKVIMKELLDLAKGMVREYEITNGISPGEEEEDDEEVELGNMKDYDIMIEDDD